MWLCGNGVMAVMGCGLLESIHYCDFSVYRYSGIDVVDVHRFGESGRQTQPQASPYGRFRAVENLTRSIR